jgi:hypothetical protein
MLLLIQLLLLIFNIVITMAQIKKEGSVPVSKYAAKKAARAKKEVETVITEETKIEEKEDIKVEVDKTETVVEQPAAEAPAPQEQTTVNKLANKAVSGKTRTVVGKEKREINVDVPDHVLEIAYIPKDNAAIRRYCSLNILNHLSQIGVIRKDGKGNYVKFLWNKFRVSSDGIIKEYSYREKFFLVALNQFANAAQQTISDFMDKEGIDSVE